MAKLFLRNNDQVALFKEELVGQLSDGAWENSSPYDHWKGWSDAELGVDANNPGLVGYSRWSFPKRGYGFVRALVNECDLSDRMIAYVVMHRVTGKLKHLSVGEYLVGEGSYEKFVEEYGERAEKEKRNSIRWQLEDDQKTEDAITRIMDGEADDKEKDKYARLIVDRILENGSPHREVVEKPAGGGYWERVFNSVDKETADKFYAELPNYTKKDLIKDLRDINKIMKMDRAEKAAA